MSNHCSPLLRNARLPARRLIANPSSIAKAMPRRHGKTTAGYKGPVPDSARNDAAGQSHGQPAGKPPRRPPLTHFLCLPLVTDASRPQLEASLARLKQDLVDPGAASPGAADGDDGAEGGRPVSLDAAGSPASTGQAQEPGKKRLQQQAPPIPEKAIRPVGTLHLTLGVMSLVSPERVREAGELLRALDLGTLLRNAAKTTRERGSKDDGSANSTDAVSTPLLISLTSLVSMHPPRKTSILYARPDDPTGRLQPFGEALRQAFAEKGLMVEDTRPLKLHATIVNTIYAKAGGRRGKGPGGGGKGQQPSVKGEEGNVVTDGEAGAKEPPADTSAAATAAGETSTVVDTPADASAGPPDTSSGHGPRARAPIRVDVTDLLPRYADFVWADGIGLAKVAICKMGARKVLDARGNVVAEEYEEVAAAHLPFAEE